jgi:hypothetical protein
MAFPLDPIYNHPTPSPSLNPLRISLHTPNLYSGSLKLRSVHLGFITTIRAQTGGIKAYDVGR